MRLLAAEFGASSGTAYPDLAKIRIKVIAIMFCLMESSRAKVLVTRQKDLVKRKAMDIDTYI